MADSPLGRFFCALPLVDRRETLFAYASRVPRRGVAPCEDLRMMQRHRNNVARRYEAGLEAGIEKRGLLQEEKFMAERAHAMEVRREQCALFIEPVVLAWLYRPPSGPMVRRLAFAATALIGEGAVNRMGSGDDEADAATGSGFQDAAERLQTEPGTDGARAM